MESEAPEVGSLWLHESGERRFVMAVDVDSDNKPAAVDCAVVLPNRDGYRIYVRITDWHAWAAKARRIDNGAR